MAQIGKTEREREVRDRTEPRQTHSQAPKKIIFTQPRRSDGAILFQKGMRLWQMKT